MAFLVVGIQQVAHATVGPLVAHVVVGVAVGNGEFGGCAPCLARGHSLLEQSVERGIVQCQEFFVTLLAQLSCFLSLKCVVHGINGVYNGKTITTELDSRFRLQLFGHVHSGSDETGYDIPRLKHLLPFQYDVGVDNNDDRPVSFQTLKEIMKKKGV